MNTRPFAAPIHALALPIVALVLASSVSLAQAINKPITQDTYDSWRAMTGPSLSQDGKWTAYTAGPVVGDGDLFVRSTTGTTEFKVPRGFTGRPQMAVNATADSGFTAAPAQFSGDSRFVAFLQYAPKAQFDAVPRGRGRGAATPRNNLGLVSLPDGNVTIIPRVRSFRLARDGGKYIAYLLESDSAAPAAGGGGRTGGGRGGRGGGAAGEATTSGGAGGARRDPGFTLVLRELATGTETKIDDVSAFTMDDAEARRLRPRALERNDHDAPVRQRRLSPARAGPKGNRGGIRLRSR
jgi:hypothetical protein